MGLPEPQHSGWHRAPLWLLPPPRCPAWGWDPAAPGCFPVPMLCISPQAGLTLLLRRSSYVPACPRTSLPRRAVLSSHPRSPSSGVTTLHQRGLSSLHPALPWTTPCAGPHRLPQASSPPAFAELFPPLLLSTPRAAPLPRLPTPSRSTGTNRHWDCTGASQVCEWAWAVSHIAQCHLYRQYWALQPCLCQAGAAASVSRAGLQPLTPCCSRPWATNKGLTHELGTLQRG